MASIFLAKALGLYAFVMAAAVFIRGDKLMGLTGDYRRHPALLMFAGIFTLILGIIMVLFHNLWVRDWRVIITVFSWLTFIKGVSIVLCPDSFLDFSDKIMSITYLRIMAVVMALLGACLLYHGFFV